MTPSELIAALSPSRLPPTLLSFGWREGLALFGIGLLFGLLIVTLVSPFLTRRPSTRARISATRGVEGEERLLRIARILGYLPASLRPAAYGAAKLPDEAEVERLARGRK